MSVGNFGKAVMDFPLMDAVSVNKGSMARVFFNSAVANISEFKQDGERDDCLVGRRKPIGADFVHIRGDARARLHTVLKKCNRVTDAAFVHLRGIHTLYMYACNQATITDAAFVHLCGIQSLSMSGCTQARTDEPLTYAPLHASFLASS